MLLIYHCAAIMYSSVDSQALSCLLVLVRLVGTCLLWGAEAGLVRAEAEVESVRLTDTIGGWYCLVDEGEVGADIQTGAEAVAESVLFTDTTMECF
jgi:hypothetical protein